MIDLKALLLVIDGAVHEANRDLVATRVLCGWRVITTKANGLWVVTAEAIRATAVTPPPEIAVAMVCIAAEAGAPASVLLYGTRALLLPRLVWVSNARVSVPVHHTEASQ